MTRMRIVVVGGGSWGTGFSCVLRHGGHDVTLACRDPEQARAINDTGHNPRFLRTADLAGVTATTIDDAPYGDADVVVLAVPSAAFADVAAALPGEAPVLNRSKGCGPATGERLSTRVQGRPFAVLSGPNMAEEIAD